MKKLCRICGEDFETIQYGNNRQYCFNCAPVYTTQQELINSRRKALKKEGMKQLGNKCYHCGYENLFALEFHHIVSEDKEHSMGNLIRDIAVELFFEELEKCAPLCSNCHKELHYLERNGQLDYDKFIQPFYTEPNFKRINRKETFVKHYCKDCGKEVGDKDTERCVTCYGLSIRKVERPDAETLIKEIKETNMVAVGKKYGVSDNSVRKWLKAYGLPTSSKEIKKM